MGPSKFDELTKLLATSTSRRQALKAITATTIGGVLSLGGIGTAFGASKCHRAGLGCDTDSNCCSGLCQNGKCVCLGLQQPCSSPNQCCDTGQGKTTCAFDEASTGVVCCNMPGGSCSTGVDCCGVFLVCSNGTCACPPTDVICVYDFECCNGMCIGGNPVTFLPGVCN